MASLLKAHPAAPSHRAAEAEAQAARLRQQLQEQEGKAAEAAAQLREGQSQLAAWNGKACACCCFGACSGRHSCPVLHGACSRKALLCRCLAGPLTRAPCPPRCALHPPMQAAELEAARRSVEGLVERMFASSALPTERQLAGMAQGLEGQAAEVRGCGK